MTPTAADVAVVARVLVGFIEQATVDPMARIHARASLALLRAALDAKDAEIQRQGEEMARLLLKLTYPADDDRVALMRMRALLADRERMGRLVWDADEAMEQHVESLLPDAAEVFSRSDYNARLGEFIAAALTAALDGTEDKGKDCPHQVPR